MTRDEKIEIIIRELAGIMPFDIRKERARILVDALEEPPAPTFRENEIVRFKVGHHWAYQVFKRLNKEDREQANKLSPAEVAASVAPMGAVFFEIESGEMCFKNREGDYCETTDESLYRIPATQWADLPDAEGTCND